MIIFLYCFLLSLIWNTVEVNSLECLVTEHEPEIDDATNEVITENGTAWKWWPMSEIHNAKLVACNDEWSVCRSRQLSDLTTTRNWPIGRQFVPITNEPFPGPPRPFPDRPTTTSTTTASTATTTLVPNKCIACGKSTWKRIGVGEEEGEVFVSLGCYGSAAGAGVEQGSCTHHPRDRICRRRPLSGGSATTGGHICSQCFCTEDGCNGGSNLLFKEKLMITTIFFIVFNGWIQK